MSIGFTLSDMKAFYSIQSDTFDCSNLDGVIKYINNGNNFSIYSALFWKTTYKYPILIKTLLEKAKRERYNLNGEIKIYNLSYTDTTIGVPIFIAAQYADSETFQYFIDYNIDIKYVDKNNATTPLHIACLYNNIDVVRLLIKKKAKINFFDFDKNTPLSIAAISKDTISFEIMKLLIEKGANINNINHCKLSILHQCVDTMEEDLQVKKTQLLIDNNVVLDVYNYQNFLPIDVAILNLNIPIVKLLLSAYNNNYQSNRILCILQPLIENSYYNLKKKAEEMYCLLSPYEAICDNKNETFKKLNLVSYDANKKSSTRVRRNRWKKYNRRATGRK